MLEYLQEQSYGVQPSLQQAFTQLESNVRQLLVALQFSSYALDTLVQADAASKTLTLKLTAPVTHWSQLRVEVGGSLHSQMWLW